MRHLEEEGFYVGPRPYVTNSNLNRMENRLLKEAGRGKAVDEEAAVGEEISGVIYSLSDVMITLLKLSIYFFIALLYLMLYPLKTL